MIFSSKNLLILVALFEFIKTDTITPKQRTGRERGAVYTIMLMYSPNTSI